MRHSIVRSVLVFGALAALLPAPATRAQGSGLQLTATLGIGGRYRPGGWIPITVGVLNPGPNAVRGQLQVVAEDASGGQVGDTLFACPADVVPGPAPQFFPLDIRGIDPASETLALTFVGGEARGDGKTLAQTSSLSTAQPIAVVGLPVAPQDPLLIGLSADTTAITSLTGQRWGLEHTASGLRPEPTAEAPLTRGGFPQFAPVFAPQSLNTPASVQAAVGSPSNLPDRPAGYDGVDAVLLRADAPLDALTETQTDALKAWVASGGHLVVCGGSDPAPYSDSFYTDLLPADIGPAAGASLSLRPKPLPGIQVLASSSGHPTVITGPYGAGQVTLLASDPTQASPHSAEAARWRTILAAAPASLLGAAATRETDTGFSSFGSEPLTEAVMRAPALDAPGADVIGLFLIGYVLVLVPLNYLVLKRLDRKEWSWGTIPALVLLFAAATYGVGYAAKGSRVFVNRAAILETTAGQHAAGVYAAVGLFSPQRTSYDLTLTDPNALAAPPMPPNPRFAVMSNPNSADEGTSGPVRVVEGGSGVRLLDASVNMWAMRAFDVQTATDMGGAITAPLTENSQTGAVRGMVTNRTQYGLTQCHLYMNGSWQSLPDLPMGAALPISLFFPPFSQARQPRGIEPSGWNQMPVPAFTSPPNAASVRQRMRVSLSQFVSGLGGDRETYGGQPFYGGGPNPPTSFQPQAHEAIFTGWSASSTLAGPPVSVDGHPVQQYAVTLVVVHIPLH